MRVIIKPGGLIALTVVCIIATFFVVTALKSKKEVTTTPTSATPTNPADKPVAVAQAFSNKHGSVTDTADGRVIMAKIPAGVPYKKLANGASVIIGGKGEQAIDLGESIIDTTQSFSVSAWVCLTATNGFQTFVSQDGTQISGFFLQKRDDSGELSFSVNSDDATTAANPTEPDPVKGYRSQSGFKAEVGKWYHIVGMYDKDAHQTKLYVNGKLTGTRNLPTEVKMWPAKGHTIIGGGFWGGARADFVNGTVDSVRLYPRVLAEDEVGYLYKNRL